MLAIRCRGLTKRYGARAVVDGLDLEVEQGEVFGFLGPERGGQDHDRPHAAGPGQGRRRRGVASGSKVPCPARLGEIGAMVEEPAFYPWMSGRRNLEILADEGARVPAGAVARGARGWPGSPPLADRRSRPTPKACASASDWPPPWCAGPRSCCSTSRPTVWTRPASTTCAPAPPSRRRGQHGVPLQPPARARSNRSVTGSPSSTRAGSSPPAPSTTSGASRQRVRVTRRARRDRPGPRRPRPAGPSPADGEGEISSHGADGRDDQPGARRRRHLRRRHHPERLSLEEWFLAITEGGSPPCVCCALSSPSCAGRSPGRSPLIAVACQPGLRLARRQERLGRRPPRDVLAPGPPTCRDSRCRPERSVRPGGLGPGADHRLPPPAGRNQTLDPPQRPPQRRPPRRAAPRRRQGRPRLHGLAAGARC